MCDRRGRDVRAALAACVMGPDLSEFRARGYSVGVGRPALERVKPVHERCSRVPAGARSSSHVLGGVHANVSVGMQTDCHSCRLLCTAEPDCIGQRVDTFSDHL